MACAGYTSYPDSTMSCNGEMRPPRPSPLPWHAPLQNQPQQAMFVPQLTGSHMPVLQQGLPVPQHGGPLVYMAVPHVSPRGYHPYGPPMLAPMDLGPHWSGNQYCNVPPQYSQLPRATAHGPAPLAKRALLALPPPQAASLQVGRPRQPGNRPVALAAAPWAENSLDDPESDSESGSFQPQPPPKKKQKLDSKKRKRDSCNVPATKKYVVECKQENLGGCLCK